MYKVFFNASVITLCSNFENSFKDNKGQLIENKDIDYVFRLLVDLESKREPENFVFVSNNYEELWSKFKAQFIGITAAGGIVTDKHDRILVIKRFGYWDLPKGKVEKNETLEKAAVREVEEECGISGVRIKDQIGSVFYMYRSPFHTEPNNLVLKETFWFEMEYDGNETPRPQYSENIEEVCWMKKDEFPRFLSNTYPNLVELMENYLQKTSEKIR